MMTAASLGPPGVDRTRTVFKQRTRLTARVAFAHREKGNAAAMGAKTFEDLLKRGREKMPLNMIRRKKDLMRLHIDRHAAAGVAPDTASRESLHALRRFRIGVVQLRHAPIERGHHLSGRPHREQTLAHLLHGSIEHLKSSGSRKWNGHDGTNHEHDQTSSLRVFQKKSAMATATTMILFRMLEYRLTARSSRRERCLAVVYER